ncbi:MAG: single-stranded DNA-binding protein [Bacteroidia bacterium]
MNSLRNNVQLIGNLGQNPEVFNTEKGHKVARFSIAAQESYTDKNGKRVINTQWFNVVAWEGMAGFAEKFLTKGRQVAIAGKLNNKSWTDKNGNKRNTIEIVATDILMLGSPRDNN